MTFRRLLSALAVFCLLAPGIASGQEVEPALEPLVVGTKEAPPFAMKRPDGSWHGLSIELWREISAELGRDHEFRELGLEELLAGVEAGELDAAVAALTITPEREETSDFSHPFHTSGLGIAVAASGPDFLATVFALFSGDFLKAVGALAVVLFIIGAIVWALERRRNPEQFGGSTVEGLGAGFWFSAVTMTTVGYGDKAPVTFAGRVVALVWMFAGLIAISGFTAAIASSLTVNRLGSQVGGPQDLPRVSVATVPGSTSAAYLDRRGIGYEGFDSPRAVLEALAGGEVEAVVYDEPMLRYLAKEEFSGRVEILPSIFQRQDYGFALPAGSELREPVNQSLLRLLSQGRAEEIRTRYLGE